MNTRDTKLIGAISELYVSADLTHAGYVVSHPYGDNAPYDLIAESTTRCLYRVQVRHGAWRRDVLSLSLRKSSHGVSTPLDLTRIDTFILYDDQDLYIVPVSHLGRRVAQYSLRRTLADSGRLVDVHYAADYKRAFHFMP